MALSLALDWCGIVYFVPLILLFHFLPFAFYFVSGDPPRDLCLALAITWGKPAFSRVVHPFEFQACGFVAHQAFSLTALIAFS